MHPYPNLSNLVLASASPRRRELLASLGLDFELRVPDIDETQQANEPPRAFAERLAEEKAAAVDCADHEVLIAADTIVVLGGNVLGKPTDAAHAVEMLRSLSGNTHEVVTGVCVRTAAGARVFSVVTQVTFRAVAAAEIAAYVASGEPMDKAGAYAIQGGAAHMVGGIYGSYTNVVGLPLCELHETLTSL